MNAHDKFKADVRRIDNEHAKNLRRIEWHGWLLRVVLAIAIGFALPFLRACDARADEPAAQSYWCAVCGDGPHGSCHYEHCDRPATAIYGPASDRPICGPAGDGCNIKCCSADGKDCLTTMVYCAPKPATATEQAVSE